VNQRLAGGGWRVVFIALLLVVAALAFAQSYERWLDPIIDTGRDLYIPEQIAHGAKLYRDIRYQYPPLTPYVLAVVTSVIGHSLAAYTAIGVLQSIAIAVALWFIGRRTAGTLAGFVAALFFVALSFCGASTWGANFLFPYSYGATIGIALIVIALAFVVHERPAPALAALFFASWCKVEYAIAAGIVIVILAIARRFSVRQVAMFILAELIAIAAALAYFPSMRSNIFAPSLTEGASAHRFFEVVSGVADWRPYLVAAIVGIAAIAAIAWLLRVVRPAIAVPIVIAISIALTYYTHAFFRAWGLLQFAGLVEGFRRRNMTLVTLSAFSIATTLRIPLSVSPVWYGFALIVPTYALIAYVLFAMLPGRSMWWLPLIALLCGQELYDQHRLWAVKEFPIDSPRGRFFDANPDRARVLNQFIQHVHGGTLAVLPEGIALDYLTERKTTLSFHTFTPVETAAPQVESAIIAEFASRPPDLVAIVSRDVTEYGYRGFGVDYDRSLSAYLTQHYRLIRQWSQPRFQMILLARSDNMSR